MNIRVKSFFITVISFLGAAFTTVIFTPQWSDFVNWANQTASAKLLGIGVPTVVIVLLGSLIAEIWKQILNKIIIHKAGFRSVTAAKSTNNVELY